MATLDRAGLVPPLAESAARPPGERLVHLRLMFVALSITLWAVVIGGRLFHLQVLGRGFFARQAARQSERTITLDPRRGPILDRNGRHLAVSVDAESIYAVPQDVTDPQATAAALVHALGLDPAARKDITTLLQRNRAFVWVKRKLDPATAQRVRDLQLDGIGFLTENRRYYPKRELASQVIGYAGLDNAGMSGIEYAFDQQIRGRQAKVVVQTDARRRPVEHTERPSTEGRTVVLTIDEAIQHAAESELERAVAESSAVAGIVVVLDPKTGEILALANRPTFNPNRLAAYSSGRWRNRAVTDYYEPGSIFKVITAAAALQEKVVEPDEILDCGGGVIEIGGTVVHDHAVFFLLPFRQVISKSSDIGMVRVAQRLGRESFHRYVRDFGFGAATGIDLPGESAGSFRPTSKWSALSLASMSFGQEIGVTGLQMASAIAAVANGGYLMRPLIVGQIEDPLGNTLKSFKPIALRRVIEPATVEILTDMLRDVVVAGTGKRAAVPGYVVAGKTGTAQKVDASGRYSMVDHVASFVGFVPASRPALVILVSLDSPKGPRNMGGDVAAPVFARVAERALRRLQIPPDQTDRVLRVVGEPIEGQIPVAFTPSATLARRPASDGPALMPDLRGLSAREASVTAARLGLVVRLEGSGQVVEQTPQPGGEIESGMTCALRLSRSGATVEARDPLFAAAGGGR